MEERERQLRGSGRSDDADLARQQRERLELPKARLALVVDQLEELFTTGFSPEIRQKYISAIAGLVRSGRVFVLATLRSDFYSWYQQFPDLIELTKPAGKVDLRPPTAYEIGNMIRLPAEAAGLRFEQERETGQRLDQALRDAASCDTGILALARTCFVTALRGAGARGDDLLRVVGLSRTRGIERRAGQACREGVQHFATARTKGVSCSHAASCHVGPGRRRSAQPADGALS